MSAGTRIAMAAGVLLALAGGVGGGGAHAQASAQAVEAVPVQGLSFGRLLPGVPETVSTSDAARRAEIVLSGTGTFDVLLVLPDALVNADGARIPLRFGARDGALMRNPSAPLLPFNPLEMGRVQIQESAGPARVLLGGTAVPAPSQAAGTYQATVVVIVNNPGT